MNARIASNTVRRVGMRGTRLWSGILAVCVLSGCASKPPPVIVHEERADDLYTGEPAVLHATEMPVASAEEARQRAAAALAERDVDLALYLYVQAANMDPDDAESIFAIATIHEDRGNLELAARAYARVIALEPGNALANQGLGMVYFNARQFEDAKGYLNEAVALDPTLWRSHNSLGVLADMDEQYSLAIEHYSAAIAVRPRQASLHNNRGYSRYLSGNLTDAKQDFLAAVDIDAGYERAWRNLGLVLAREGNYDRALSAMMLGIERHVALNDIGYVAMLDGNYQVAQSYFEEAIRVSPRYYPTARDNLTELNRRRSSQAALTVQ